jgi:hypothetical protein
MALNYRFSKSQIRLLSDLLDRDERATPGRMVSVTVQSSRFPDYFDEENPERVRSWQREVDELAALGWIALDRGKNADAHRYVRIRLDRSKVVEISKSLDRMSADTFREKWVQLLDRSCKDLDEATRARWLEYLRVERERYREHAPPAEARRQILSDNELLFSAVDGLVELRNRNLSEDRVIGVPWRQFALERTGSSKGLEKIKTNLLQALQWLLSDESPQELKDASDAILSYFGILSKEEIFLVRGPATLRKGPTRFCLDGSDWEPFFCVPASVGLDENVTWDLASVTGMLTIENEESFHHWCRQKLRPNWLVIYLAGFPSLNKKRFLQRFVHTGLPLYHWGDLDCGGIEILLYLRSALCARVSPFAMSSRVLRDLAARTQPLSQDELRRLERIKKKIEAEDPLKDLVNEMEVMKVKLEQEAISDPTSYA